MRWVWTVDVWVLMALAVLRLKTAGVWGRKALALDQPHAVGEDHEARIQRQEHREPVDEVPLLCFVPRGTCL